MVLGKTGTGVFRRCGGRRTETQSLLVSDSSRCYYFSVVGLQMETFIMVVTYVLGMCRGEKSK